MTTALNAIPTQPDITKTD